MGKLAPAGKSAKVRMALQSMVRHLHPLLSLACLAMVFQQATEAAS